MKSLKKLTAVFLNLIMLICLLMNPASAADGAGAAGPVFILFRDQLMGVDLSGVICDVATINTDILKLVDADGNVARACFDPEKPGVVKFGGGDDRSFYDYTIRTYGVNYTFSLYPPEEGEVLYDDVASYTFSMRDVFDTTDTTEIELCKPTVTVTECEGETVRTMTLDFSFAQTSAPMFLDSVDLSQTLPFSVRYAADTLAEITLQPTAYDAETGVLTVSVRDGKGQEGVQLHDLISLANGTVMPEYRYCLTIPGGFFTDSRNEKVRNKAACFEDDYLYDIDGMPYRIGMDWNVPAGAAKLYARLRNTADFSDASCLVKNAFGFLIFVFSLPTLLQFWISLAESLASYGIKYRLGPLDRNDFITRAIR